MLGGAVFVSGVVDLIGFYQLVLRLHIEVELVLTLPARVRIVVILAILIFALTETLRRVGVFLRGFVPKFPQDLSTFFLLPFEQFEESFWDLELDFLFMLSEVKKFNLLYLYIHVAKPLVDVAHVLLLDVFELVCRKVNASIQKWHLELASIDLEIAIHDRQGAPAQHLVRRRVFRTEINQLKNDNV